jgi:penicillin-binding protein A
MTLERRAWNICRVAVLLLILLSFRLVHWQMVRGEHLKPTAIDLVQAASEYPQADNSANGRFFNRIRFLTGLSTVKQLESIPQPVVQRTMDFLNSITRGSIYDRSGRLLAYDQRDEEGKRFRFYSEPSLAHVIGYVSGMRTGVTGIELSYNNSLLGLDRADSHIAHMLHKPISGSDLYLTIDRDLQRAAERALREKSGVILVMDAKSGAVLALANAPRFDPNRILDHVYVSELVSSCRDAPHCRAPFINRAAQGLYSPGSTWKTVALIAALESGQVSGNTVFDFGEPLQGADGPYYIYRVDGGTIPDYNHRERQLTLEMSYAKSANAAFARIGDEMPPEVLIEYAARFGFGSPGEIQFAMDIESIPSQLANNVESLYENNLLRAVTAIGQGELLATPLNMGMMVLSVVNDGSIPVPYFVQAVKEPNGRVIENLSNRQVIPDVMSSETAEQVREMMISVVDNGSGQRARLPGLVVGGKTGTAQVGGGMDPHAWFAGFALEEERGVVVVVLIEQGGEGSKTAAPIFSDIALAAFQRGADLGEDFQSPPEGPETPASATEPVDAPITIEPQEPEEPPPMPEPEQPPPQPPAP